MDALVILNELEITCLKKFAQLFESGQAYWDKEKGFQTLGLTEENYQPVFTTMENLGYISVDRVLGGWTGSLVINYSVVQAVRMIIREENKGKEGKDIVENVKVTLRKHPVGGWIIVVFMAITGLAIAVTQISGALKTLGLIK